MTKIADVIFEIGQRYSFDLYGGAVLPYKILNAKIVSVLDGRTAERLGYNVAAKHAQVYAILPVSATVTKDFTSQRYYEVEHPDGSRQCFGEAWIRYDTVEKLTVQDIIVTLKDVTPAQLDGLNQVLAANGYKIKSVTKTEI